MCCTLRLVRTRSRRVDGSLVRVQIHFYVESAILFSALTHTSFHSTHMLGFIPKQSGIGGIGGCRSICASQPSRGVATLEMKRCAAFSASFLHKRTCDVTVCKGLGLGVRAISLTQIHLGRLHKPVLLPLQALPDPTLLLPQRPL